MDTNEISYSWKGRWEEIAFLSFVQFAAKDGDMMAKFRSDTGNTYQSPTSPAEQEIDTACGKERDFIQAFIGWCELQYGAVSEVMH